MSSKNTNSNIQFLAGGGEMGELIQKKDWSKNPIGTPDTWPQSLRTTLSIILNSKFPMFLFWGPELICFYNDAYRPSLGKEGKHPQILGGRGEDFWKEIWKDIKPLIDQVLEKGEATWHEDLLLPIYRNGKMEDVYWTFSYSPVNDESGKPAGVFVTCSETTNKVNVFKQLNESNERYLNNIIQAPMAMCIFRGEDFIVEIANDRMLEIWGKKAEDVMNKPVFEGVPEAKGQNLEILLENVYKTGEKFVAHEHPIQLLRNGKLETTYINFVYEALYETDGSISGVVAAAADVSKQKQSIETIEKMATHLKLATDSAKVGIWSLNIQTEKLEWSTLHKKIWGYDENSNDLTYEDWHKIILPEDKEQAFKKVEESRLNNSFYEVEYRIRRADDDNIRTIRSIGKYYYNSNGEAETLTGISIDITPQKEIEQKVRALVENAPFAIAVYTGEEMRVELANETIINIWGKGNDVIGKKFTEILPELEDQLVFEQIKDVYNSGKAFHTKNTPLELVVNGIRSTYFFNYSFTPLFDLSGKIYGVMNTGIDLTDLNLAKKKIEQNEEKLNIVVEASELGMWELNLKTNEAIYSAKYLEIIGGYNEPIKLSHKDLLKHLHPEDLPIRNKAMKEAMISGKLEFEARLIWKDKSVHWMEGRGKVFYDADNQPEKMIGTIRDITKERNDHQLLMDNEQKFRLLSDSMPQHIWTSDVDGNLNYFNKSVMEYSGLSLKEIEKKGWLDIVHPDDREENVKRWIHAISTGEDFLYEHRFRRHDGKYRWQLSRAIPQKDKNGKIRMWVGTSTDIQDQKTFATELERQVTERTRELNLLNEILKQSEERYHLMVGEVQDYAILYLNTNGIVENWNKGAEKIKGYKAEEIIGKSFENFYTPEDKANNLPKYLLSQAAEKGRFGQEGWRVRKDGTLFWANVVITAVHNEDGKIIGFSKVTHDLTSKKKADDKIKMNAAELELKNQELEKMNKELQSFAYISSHDLQEPLRKIQTFANLIIDKEFDNLSETGKDKFKRMQNAAQRMQTLINDLLAYSRTNTQEIKLTKTNLNELINEVIDDLEEEIQQKNATIEVEKIPSEVAIVPFQIHQLMFNLVSNSLKFSREDVSPVITIKNEIKKGKELNNQTLHPEINYCHITFSDNGIGFEQQYSEKIFEVFQRLHGKETYQGTGIGLAIVKKIIDNHKGVITASGSKNKGATFDIYLPVKG